MIKRFGLFVSLIILFSIAAVPVFSGGSRESSAKPDDGKIRVFVSILPQKYFAEKIGGDRVKVDVMVLPGRSPATYEPSPNQVTELSRADIFFTIGLPFENAFIPRISDSLKSLKISDTSRGIQKRYLESHLHDEGESAEVADEEHEGGSLDPHIWLSPELVKKQAENMLETLVETDPDYKDLYTKGYSELLAELDDLNLEIGTALAPFKGGILFVFHPSFGYFADAYGLRQVAVELEGREPTPSELKSVIEYANKENVKIIFAQPEFSTRAVEALANAVNGSVIVLNPLNPDYITGMREIATEIRKAYK